MEVDSALRVGLIVEHSLLLVICMSVWETGSYVWI